MREKKKRKALQYIKTNAKDPPPEKNINKSTNQKQSLSPF